MTTLLLTGASGLVGSRLLPRLAQSGSTAARSSGPTVPLPPGTTAVRGDLADGPAHYGQRWKASTRSSTSPRCSAPTTRTPSGGPTSTAPATWSRPSTATPLEPGSSWPARATSTTPTPHVRPSRPTPARPTAAYPASKVAAEQVLRDSGLTWSILRLPFVYGDGDGHLASLAALAERFGLHPAHTYSVVHHRDVATVMRLALAGNMDRRIVNVTDDAPVTVYEMTVIAGNPIAGSAEPLDNPWSGRMDGTLVRELGFRPTVPTIHAAAREGIL